MLKKTNNRLFFGTNTTKKELKRKKKKIQGWEVKEMIIARGYAETGNAFRLHISILP